MKYEIEKWADDFDGGYARRLCEDLTRKKIEVENALLLRLGCLVARVQHEYGASMDNMGRTVFVGKDGHAIATVTVKMREDGSHIDIIAEPVLACDLPRSE